MLRTSTRLQYDPCSPRTAHLVECPDSLELMLGDLVTTQAHFLPPTSSLDFALDIISPYATWSWTSFSVLDNTMDELVESGGLEAIQDDISVNLAVTCKHNHGNKTWKVHTPFFPGPSEALTATVKERIRERAMVGAS